MLVCTIWAARRANSALKGVLSTETAPARRASVAALGGSEVRVRLDSAAAWRGLAGPGPSESVGARPDFRESHRRNAIATLPRFEPTLTTGVFTTGTGIRLIPELGTPPAGARARHGGRPPGIRSGLG